MTKGSNSQETSRLPSFAPLDPNDQIGRNNSVQYFSFEGTISSQSTSQRQEPNREHKPTINTQFLNSFDSGQNHSNSSEKKTHVKDAGNTPRYRNSTTNSLPETQSPQEHSSDQIYDNTLSLAPEDLRDRIPQNSRERDSFSPPNQQVALNPLEPSTSPSQPSCEKLQKETTKSEDCCCPIM